MKKNIIKILFTALLLGIFASPSITLATTSSKTQSKSHNTQEAKISHPPVKHTTVSKKTKTTHTNHAKKKATKNKAIHTKTQKNTHLKYQPHYVSNKKIITHKHLKTTKKSYHQKHKLPQNRVNIQHLDHISSPQVTAINNRLDLINKQYGSVVSKVLRAAYAQIGKPYRFASAGPNKFDCSGLTMYCYAKVGIHLPHSALEQSSCSNPVAYNDLQPGDLVFFREAGHVGIYVGNGQFIHAPRTGESVRVDYLAMRHDYYSACRPRTTV